MALASRRGIAARYFALRHPLPARRFLRRLQKRASRIASLAQWKLRDAVGTPRGASATAEPWWVRPAAAVLRCDVADWLVLSERDADKSIGFLFAPGDDYPCVVAKIAASSPAVARVERGYRALMQLRDAGVTRRGMAPDPWGLVVGPTGEVAAIESAIRGTWLDSRLRRANELEYGERVTDWLIDLAVATRGPERDDSGPALFRDVVESFRENVADLVDAGFLHEACAMISRVERLPTVFEHHDCAPWNIYVTRQGLAAFDWDNANPRGVPGFDLIQVLARLGFAIDGSLGSHRFADSRRRRETGRLGAALREWRSRYASAVGIDPNALEAIRVFAWMRLTNDEIESRRRGGGSIGRDEVDRSMLGLWLEEARSAMDS